MVTKVGGGYFHRRDTVIYGRDVINSAYSALPKVDKVGESSTACMNTICCIIVVWYMHGTSMYAVLHNTRVAYAYHLLNNIQLM